MERRIKKGGNVGGVIVCPPDKSITHRAIMLGGFFGGNRVKNALLGDDCISTAECLRRLGSNVVIDGDCVKVGAMPTAKASDDILLNTGNSGTTTRLISGLLASRYGKFTISGDESLNSRPMQRIITPLSLMGGKIESNNGKAPLVIYGKQLCGINFLTDVPSAQVKSAIILAAINAVGSTEITENNESRNHTELMLKAFGAKIRSEKQVSKANKIFVEPSEVRARDIEVPGDISSAAYPLIYSLISKKPITVKNVGINQTRTGILDVFAQMGVKVELTNRKDGIEPSADITVTRNGTLKPFDIGGEIMPRLIDEIPALCVLATFCEGTSRVRNGEELKVKESNRQKTTVDLVRALGGIATETENGIEVTGTGKLKGGIAESHFDHRIAMSAAVAIEGCEGDIVIKDADCVFVSFPNFYEIMGL